MDPTWWYFDFCQVLMWQVGKVHWASGSDPTPKWAETNFPKVSNLPSRHWYYSNWNAFSLTKTPWSAQCSSVSLGISSPDWRRETGINHHFNRQSIPNLQKGEQKVRKGPSVSMCYYEKWLFRYFYDLGLDTQVWFWCYNGITMVKQLYPRVRCGFGNVFYNYARKYLLQK